ncbi:MAG: hypothetical protein RJA70_476 [Pseudomonadota bacterium]|jgi:predicted RNA-binding protein (virulence factor B family)
MSIEDLLGRTHSLTVARQSAHGAALFMSDSEQGRSSPTLLLPRAEVPEGTEDGAILEVFVYRDSEDRPIATTIAPKVELDEVAFLTIKEVTDIGAFADWGLAKDLLVPFAEQTRELQPGDRQAIGVKLDRTGRLCGTMRIRELLRETDEIQPGEWVAGEAWRKENGVGLFVILERRFLALLPEAEPHALRRGEAASFRVARVSADNKIEVSLRKLAHEAMDADADHVLGILSGPNPPRMGDRTPPDEIRSAFGLSKKAFKRAVGRLLKQGVVELGEKDIVAVKPGTVDTTSK